VSVNIKKIVGLPGEVFYHTYLLTQDSETGVITYAGSRSSTTDSGGVGGFLVGHFGPFTADVAFGDATAPVVASVSWSLKGSCDPINRSFKASSDRITGARYRYDPSDFLYGHNSNAFTYTLLVDYGEFKFFFLIAEVTGWDVLLTAQNLGIEALPGWLDGGI
jgi:hypothetical protein